VQVRSGGPLCEMLLSITHGGSDPRAPRDRCSHAFCHRGRCYGSRVRIVGGMLMDVINGMAGRGAGPRASFLLAVAFFALGANPPPARPRAPAGHRRPRHRGAGSGGPSDLPRGNMGPFYLAGASGRWKTCHFVALVDDFRRLTRTTLAPYATRTTLATYSPWSPPSVTDLASGTASTSAPTATSTSPSLVPGWSEKVTHPCAWSSRRPSACNT
jgi:hypothetical protein